MKQINLIFAVVFFAIISCSEQSKKMKLTGTVINSDKNVVYIHLNESIDTLQIDNNIFKYEKLISNPEFIRIHFGQQEESHVLLVDSAEDITASFDAKNFMNGFKSTGSEGTSLIVTLNEHYNDAIKKIENLNIEYNNLITNESLPKDSVIRKRQELQSQYKIIIDNERDFLEKFVLQNYSSMAAMSALFQTFDYRTNKPLLLDKPENIYLYEKVDSILKIKYPQSATVESFHSNLLSLKTNLEMQKIRDKHNSLPAPEIGGNAPDISLPGIDGNIISMSSLQGKYILLDFWASWCMPCRKENPNLVDAYNKFKNKNFEIFQISLDNSRNAWIEAIKKDGLIWKYHVSDLKKWESEATAIYKVNGIPANFLIDPNGKIIAKNLRGNQLIETLNNILK